MDPMDNSAAISAGVKKRHLNKKGRKWHKRPHLRKPAVQPPTMQSKDKCGPKKIADEWEQSKVWPSSKRTPKEAQPSRCMTNDCENLLKFSCTQCSDNLEYAPRDLVRHFKDKHRGSPPVFSCHMCTFNTHQFSYLQIHLLSHKDTFSSCSICNDGVQRTWPEFSAHLTMCHCQNGIYSCETCRRFSTGDVGVFLEHIYVHNFGLEGARDDLLLHTKDKTQSAPKPTTLSCQHCGYEASQKWLLTKHIKAIHVCQNGDQRQKKKGVNSIAMKPNDPIPKMKPRLTRSAVREMCWLTQDCLSLPGREFLDKYCHLSDPQTTLEETQKFLMKSVAGETGDQKWTKALKTVLSNVPQDVNLHPKSENGIMSNASDLTVLTVKKKITVAQNGAYAKRLRRMTASDKETVLPGSAAEDVRCAVDQKGCQSTVTDYLPCPQTDTKLHNDVLVSAQSETTECTQMEENIENQDLKTEQEIEEHRKKHQEPVQEDTINISSELKLTNESVKPTCVNKVKRRRRRNRRCKRKPTSKKVDTRSTGQPLKIVLKKNPVKGKQWVSKSSSSSSGGQSAAQKNYPLPEVHQQKLTEASKTDLCDLEKAIPSIPQSKQEEVMPDCISGSVESENMNSNEPAMLKELPSAQLEMNDDLEKSLQFSQTGDDERISAAEMESNLSTDAETKLEMCPSNTQQLQTSGGDMGHHESDDKKTSADEEEVTAHSSCSKSSASVSQPVIIPQGDVNLDDSSLALSLEKSNHSVEGIRDGEVPVESCSDLLSSTYSPVEKAIQQEPSPASGHRRHSVPKNKERTLKLVAINPSQLVKRPAGDQPVVVLNHPDVDIPEVARIMEVVNRYRGEVQKVMLSCKTLNALSAMSGEAQKTHDPTEVPPDPSSTVKERFILKLKFRKLNKRKYEVVSAVSASREVATKFRCWFCGRVFASQEMWMTHRKRHLLEWKRPNCENS